MPLHKHNCSKCGEFYDCPVEGDRCGTVGPNRDHDVCPKQGCGCGFFYAGKVHTNHRLRFCKKHAMVDRLEAVLRQMTSRFSCMPDDREGNQVRQVAEQLLQEYERSE